MNYLIHADITRFPWKLTVNNQIIEFVHLSDAERKGKERDRKKEGFVIEHIIETRHYVSAP